VLDGVVRRAVPQINDSILLEVQQAFGTSFVDNFGIPVDDLPTCGHLPDGSLNHFDCSAAYYRGGRRHRCSERLNSSGENVCDEVHLEIRRIHVRPEGIELVLAESEADPQFALLDGRNGLIAPGSALALVFGPDPLICDEVRLGLAVSEVATPFELAGEAAALGSLIPSVPICDRSDALCTGICPQFGTTCANARTFGLDRDSLPNTGTLRCVHGTCQVVPP
jgi:hypothetical protein